MESIQKMPEAKQIQPIGFSGRLEEIRAPTRGKARKGTTKMSTALAPPVPQVLGGCTDRARTYNTIAAPHTTSERVASDQASQKAAGAPPRTRPRSFAASITTPLYSTTVFQSLRQTLRRSSYVQEQVNFLELRKAEVRRINLLRTSVNRYKRRAGYGVSGPTYPTLRTFSACSPFRPRVGS